MNRLILRLWEYGTPYSPGAVLRRINHAYEEGLLRVYLNHDPLPPYIVRVCYGESTWVSIETKGAKVRYLPRPSVVS